MDSILLSIIIPHYNCPDKLGRLLDSITVRPEIEVIVVDDMSTEKQDILKQIIAREKENRSNFIFLINTPDNKGGGGARNLGVRHAIGRWLMFADADDWFLPSFYETVSKYYDSDADIVYFSVTSFKECKEDTSDIVAEKGSVPGSRHYYFKSIEEVYTRIKAKSRLRDLWFKKHHEVPWGKMIRHSLVVDNDCRFDVVMCSNDIGFSSRVAIAADSIIVDPTEIYVVEESVNSLTTNHTKEAKKIRASSRRARNKLWKNELSFKEWFYVNTRYNPLNYLYFVFVNMNFDKGQKLHRKIVQKLTWEKYRKRQT